MTGDVKPPAEGGKGTHTRYCYLLKKRKGPDAHDPKCWCATGQQPAPAPAPETGTTDRQKLVEEIIKGGMTRPNTAPPPTAGPEPAPRPAGGAGVSAMFVTGGLFRFIGARLNKLFETEDFGLSKEEADAMAEAFTAAISTSGKPVNPWMAFIVMLICWLGIPMMEHLPKLMEKMGGKKDGKQQSGKPAAGGFFGLKLRRPEHAAPEQPPEPAPVGAAG